MVLLCFLNSSRSSVATSLPHIGHLAGPFAISGSSCILPTANETGEMGDFLVRDSISDRGFTNESTSFADERVRRLGAPSSLLLRGFLKTSDPFDDGGTSFRFLPSTLDRLPPRVFLLEECNGGCLKSGVSGGDFAPGRRVGGGMKTESLATIRRVRRAEEH